MPVLDDFGDLDQLGVDLEADASPRLELLPPRVPTDPCDSDVTKPLPGTEAEWLAERTGRLVLDAGKGRTATVAVSAWRYADPADAESLVAAATTRLTGCQERDRGIGASETLVPPADSTGIADVLPLATWGWDVTIAGDVTRARYAYLVRGATALRVAVVGTGGSPLPDVHLLALRVHNRVLPLDRRAVPADPDTGGRPA